MFDKHKRESLLLRDLLKKLIIIVIGSIVAAYGITLALYAGFGGATLAVLWQGIFCCSSGDDFVCINLR